MLKINKYKFHLVNKNLFSLSLFWMHLKVYIPTLAHTCAQKQEKHLSRSEYVKHSTVWLDRCLLGYRSRNRQWWHNLCVRGTQECSTWDRDGQDQLTAWSLSVPAKSCQSCPTFCNPMNCIGYTCKAPLSMGFSRQDMRSALPEEYSKYHFLLDFSLINRKAEDRAVDFPLLVTRMVISSNHCITGALKHHQ